MSASIPARSSGRWPADPGPKVDATDERGDDGADLERYETLRRRALGGDASGWRLGLAVLVRQGVAAWLRAGEPIPTPSPLRPPADLPADGGELVGVLATMALACLGAG